MRTLAHLLDDLQNLPVEFRPVSFWFMNHFLQPEELRRQVREMADKGYGGFMFHGRDGLRSRYLEQEWADALRVAIDEAQKVGLHAWLYDENHYPSGIMGGKIWEKFPDRNMRSLRVVTETRVAPGAQAQIDLPEAVHYAFAVPCPAAPAQNAAPLPPPLDLRPRIGGKRLEWQNSFATDAVVLVLAEHRYQPGPGNVFENYPDYLDPEVSGAFIQGTHGWYREQLGADLGKHVRGIFTDNGCAHFGHVRRAIPWSREFDRRFQAAAGTPIEQVLPWLFLPGPEARVSRLRFWRFLGDEFIRTFVGAIRTVCDDARIFSTGHYCLEDGLGEHVRQIGDYFAVMKNQSLNAVDQLGPGTKGGSLFASRGMERVTACVRNTASAALFYDSPRVMCESFGLASGWRLDLGETRRIAGFLAALGVDLFVPHGLYYSIAGSRKWECTPDHLHNPMWPHSRAWTDYAGRLSFLSAGGESVAEVGVLHPTTTLQAHLELGAPKPNRDATDLGPVNDRVEATFRELVDCLLHHHISHEIMPEDVLQRGTVAAGVLRVPTRGGKSACAFRCVILPAVRVLEQGSLDLLRQFVQSGGTVICLYDRPDAAYNPGNGTLADLAAADLSAELLTPEGEAVPAPTVFWQNLDARLRELVPQPLAVTNTQNQIISRVWEKWGMRFHLLHNCAARPMRNLRVTMRDPRPLSRLDLDQPTSSGLPPAAAGGSFRLDLDAAESALFVAESATAGQPQPAVPAARVSIPKQFAAIAGPWTFTTAKPNILPLRAGQVRFSGTTQRTEFSFRAASLHGPVRLLVDYEMTRAELICERYSGRLKVRVNGQLAGPFLPGEYLDHWIFEADVAAFLRRGLNRVEIETGGAYLDSDRRLWNPYLVGEFSVREGAAGLSLAAPVTKLDLGDWTQQGFPFYTGEGIYRKTIRLPAWRQPQTSMLDLGRLANSATVAVNGQPLGLRVNPPWRFVLPALPGASEATLEVRVINTPENLFGPEPLPAGLFGPIRLSGVD